MVSEISTNPAELELFHSLLKADAPEGYQPFYFPLEKNGKDPHVKKGESWKNKRLSFSEAYSLMQEGYNIGIAATDQDKLCIVDVDDKQQVGEIKSTLKVQSRKRLGEHNFYFTNDKLGTRRSAKNNIPTENAGEVRSNWQYVVAAGSFVPCSKEEIEMIPADDKENAGKYTVLQATDVASITFEELPGAYKNQVYKKEADAAAKLAKDSERKIQRAREKENNGTQSALWFLDIHDITGKLNDPNFKFSSPFHDSKTYKDTSVSGDVMHCWRHLVSHNAFTYMAVEAGLTTCSSGGYPHGGGSSNIDTKDPYTVFTLWKHAKDRGYIPKDDPIPALAMIYLALENKFCEKKDVTEGWKLPEKAYNQVLGECRNAGIEPGRKNLEKKTGVRKAAKKLLSGLSVSEVVDGLQEEVPIYFDSGKSFWMWNDDLHVFERTDETEIMVQITEHLDLTIYNKDFKNQILEGIRQTGRARRVKPTKKEWIQFQNCVIDVETGKTFEATPDYFFVSQIPHKLGKSEDTPLLDQLFTDWQGDKADLLKEICAYCLLDDYPIQRIFAFIGPGGNGKGQFMKFIKTLLGEENTVGTDLDRLSDSRFEAAKLFKKKAAFVGETKYTLSKTSMLKSLTGGDTISGEFKNKDPFDFVNTAKMIVATNGLPITTDRSEGFYRRWCLIEFKNSFPDGKDIINTVPEGEYQNFCKKAVRLLREIIDSGKLHEPDIQGRKEQYEKLSNPIQAFIDEECKVSEELFTPVWHLYENYNRYREERGHRHILQNEFAKIVEGMGYNRKQKWFSCTDAASFKNNPVSDKDKNWMTFEGIAMKPRGTSRKNNQPDDIEKTLENGEPRGSMSKTHLPPYIEPNPILPLEPLGIEENREQEAISEQSKTTSRFLFSSRISEQGNKASLEKFIECRYKEPININHVAMDFCKTQEGRTAFEELGLAKIKEQIEQIVNSAENFNLSVVSAEEAARILDEEGI